MRRALTTVAAMVAVALVASACGDNTHEPTGEQRQAVIDYVTHIYERDAHSAQQRGEAIDIPTPGEILAKSDELCRELSILWWGALDIAAYKDPSGWAGREMLHTFFLGESGYCPRVDDSWDEYQESIVDPNT